MSTTHPCLKIEAHTLAGTDENQDRHIVGYNYAAVLDGASAFGSDATQSGGIYADRLATALKRRLVAAPDDDLRKILANAIFGISALPGGPSASSTVVIARWAVDVVDILCLGDSTAVVVNTSGQQDVITDTRINRVAPQLRSAYRAALREGQGFSEEHRRRLAALQSRQAEHRNKAGGYWIASNDPQAASEAFVRRFPSNHIARIVLATDGAASLVDRYRILSSWSDPTIDWPSSLAKAQDLERRDPHGQKWPRSKLHDDKTAVVIDRFLECSACRQHPS